MKTNTTLAATCQNVYRNLKVTIIASLLVALATNANAHGPFDDHFIEAKKPTFTLTEQISQYIEVDKMDVSKLKSGIVIISFSVNKQNELTHVVSHSQIPALDRFLTSSLEGKPIQIAAKDLTNRDQHYVKIRFTLDNQSL